MIPDPHDAASAPAVAAIDNGPDTVPLGNGPDTVPRAEPATAGPSEYAFQFTGRTGEYFGIWIVNLFLTIITLGIYSAWAKVRKKRYLYGHTWVADANFEYHGNPIAILKGRLIAAAIFVTYSVLARFMPQVAAVLALVVFAAAPWFIARSMAFNAFNSSYRNIRFRFHATYGDVLRCIAPMALVLVFSLLMPEIDQSGKKAPPTLFWVVFGLQMFTIVAVYPYVVGALKRLHVNHSQFGESQFACAATIGAFYQIYVLNFLLFLAILAVAGAIGAVVGGIFGMAAMFLLPFFLLIGYLGAGALSVGYVRSRVGNLVFNKTTLDKSISFSSVLSARKLAGIYVINLLAIVCSLGLAVPWAVIRVARYRAECLSMQSAVPFEQFVGGVAANVAATGEELGEFFNIDLSL